MSFKTADLNSEYAKDNKLKKDDVTCLQEWARKQPHLPQISELQFILFLQSCYFSIEAAKNTIDTYFMLKALTPEIFNDRDPLLLKEAMETVCYCILPKTTPDGDTLLYGSLLEGTANKFVLSDQIKLFDMTTMLSLTQEGSMKSYVIIADVKLGHFGHIPRINIILLKKFLYYLQEAMPIRLKAVHFVNMVPAVETLVSMVKPFMKKEFLDLLHFHTTSNENLYKVVPKECLPKEVGGFGNSVAALNAIAKKRLIDNREFFLQDQLQIGDKSHRSAKTKISSELGFEGSFKKLDID